MASSISPYKYGILRYLRYKVMATIFRFVVLLTRLPRDRRDLYLPANMKVEKIQIPSRETPRTINVFIYYPPGKSSSSGPLPVLINWHGSGFVLPFHGQDRAFCTRMARDAGVVVVDGDYRKGPEYPFPAAVHDVIDTIRWVHSHPERFDISRIALSGFSAGGNLALVASAMSASSVKDGDQQTASSQSGHFDGEQEPDLKDVSIKAVISYYPPTDISIDPPARKAPKAKDILPPGVVSFFNACYVPDESLRKDRRISPLLGDLTVFPKTVAIFTCEGDTLCPEAEEFAHKIDDGSRKVVLRRLKDVGHAWDKGVAKGSNDEKVRDEAYGETVKVLKEAFEL